ncbi:probable disease resistance protein At4g27220 isoform X1 [Mangifera indica]|uniref:probable disease resistance protein At4g27220 isoform X1 n=1 Tax=Mangifera indica TaxID=29780 RepID=UPI001CF9B77D|nr:probable disease resistance protein At4g27220 isoform X1 [Mangifera indica]
MANKIYSRMENKNILLILDNIWKPVELDKMVGIPCGADRGRKKLLFTTRNVDVLERMGSTNNFRMGFLNDDEAWTLFTKMTGDVIQTRELYSLSNEVCKECGGLPIVICTIAKALKNKSHPSDWKVALQELRAPTPTKFTGFLEEEYTKIALSYKYLRDELKKLFLFSSLLENNTSISDLFKHVVCLDILEGANLTMEEARDRLDKLVRDLKDASLLLGELKSKQFAMHDVVRVVAITIAYVDYHVFTTRNDVEREWKDRDKLKKCTKISLLGNSPIISQLWPNYFSFPNLEYFYITNMRKSSFKFPKDIFKVMPKLRVMNLVGLQQPSLLSSVVLLTSLQSLCLDYSEVKNFAIIRKLKTLKVLSLQNSIIKEFPIELGQLIQLRLLDLSEC